MDGLGILDISDLKKPVRISQLYLGGGYAIEVQERLAFVASGHKGLNIIDVTNPLSPSAVGSHKMPRFTYGLAVEADYAYLANNDTGFHILDIRKPGAPKLEASFDTPGEAKAVVVSGPLVLVADSNSLIILK
jgi:hypothetical protein